MSTEKTFKLYSLHKWDLLCFLLLDTYWDVQSNSVTEPLQRPARCGIVQSLIQRSWIDLGKLSKSGPVDALSHSLWIQLKFTWHAGVW